MRLEAHVEEPDAPGEGGAAGDLDDPEAEAVLVEVGAHPVHPGVALLPVALRQEVGHAGIGHHRCEGLAVLGPPGPEEQALRAQHGAREGARVAPAVSDLLVALLADPGDLPSDLGPTEALVEAARRVPLEDPDEERGQARLHETSGELRRESPAGAAPLRRLEDVDRVELGGVSRVARPLGPARGEAHDRAAVLRDEEERRLAVAWIRHGPGPHELPVLDRELREEVGRDEALIGRAPGRDVHRRDRARVLGASLADGQRHAAECSHSIGCRWHDVAFGACPLRG